MKHCQNKSNLAVIQDYLDGSRPFTQIGYTGKKYKKRAVGDRWIDAKGVEWEQKISGPQRFNRVAEIIKKAIGVEQCKCGMEIRWGRRLDNLFYRKTGLCENCLITYETKLRAVGIYDYYERWKMISNKIGMMKDAEDKIKETINFFEADTGDITILCNSEGFTERWKNTNREKILEDAKKDLQMVTEHLEKLIPLRDEYKQKYIENAQKYNLEVLCPTPSLTKT